MKTFCGLHLNLTFDWKTNEFSVKNFFGLRLNLTEKTTNFWERTWQKNGANFWLNSPLAQTSSYLVVACGSKITNTLVLGGCRATKRMELSNASQLIRYFHFCKHVFSIYLVFRLWCFWVIMFGVRKVKIYLFLKEASTSAFKPKLTIFYSKDVWWPSELIYFVLGSQLKN